MKVGEVEGLVLFDLRPLPAEAIPPFFSIPAMFVSKMGEHEDCSAIIREATHPA